MLESKIRQVRCFKYEWLIEKLEGGDAKAVSKVQIVYWNTGLKNIHSWMNDIPWLNQRHVYHLPIFHRQLSGLVLKICFLPHAFIFGLKFLKIIYSFFISLAHKQKILIHAIYSIYFI